MDNQNQGADRTGDQSTAHSSRFHGHFIEIQGTAEFGDFTNDSLAEMLAAAKTGLDTLFQVQANALTETGSH